MLILLLIKIQGITIKHLFIKGGVMIGLGCHTLFSYLNKEVAWPSGQSTGLAIGTPQVQALL